MKSLKREIFKNFSWLSLSEIISRSFKFLFLIYLARILGARKYGILSFAMNTISLFVIFADFGISTILTREIAKNRKKAKDYFSSLLSLKILLFSFFFFFIFLLSLFIAKEIEIRKIFFIFAFYGIFSSFFDYLNSFFRGFEKFSFEASGKILNAILCAGIGIFTLFNWPSLLNISLVYFFSIFSTSLFLLFLLKAKFFPLSIKFEIKTWKKFLSLSWPLLFIAIFSSIFHWLDSVMLGVFGQFRENGWYNASYKIIDISIIPAILLSLVIFPQLSKNFFHSQKRKKIIFSHLFLSFSIGFPLLLGGFILSDKLILFFYGKDYFPSILSLKILLFSAFLFYLLLPFFRALVAGNFQKELFKITFLGAILNFFLNFLLIPKYSLYGAGIATGLTYLFVFGLSYLTLKKFAPFKINLAPFLLPISATFLMALSISFISLSLFLKLFLGIFLYFIFIFFFSKIFKVKI